MFDNWIFCMNSMKAVHYFSLLLIVVGAEGVKKHEVSAESRLLNYLLEDYHVNARPIYDPKGTVNVTIDIAYNQLLQLDEKQQLLMSNVWLRLYWVDETLTWNPADFNNITIIYIFPENIWKPDIILYNRADQQVSTDKQAMYPLSVTPGGAVAMLVPFVLTSSCIVDVTFFPYDIQMCPLQFGSWGIDGTRLDIHPKSASGDVAVFLDNGQWLLERVVSVRTVTLYSCCPEPYPDVTYEIHLKRKPLYYVLHLLLPSFMISFTSVGAFLLPAESGEKVTLTITILLAATFFLMIVGDIMPATSNSLPIIGMLFLGQIILLMGTTLVTVFVVNISMRSHYSGEVPQWLRWFAFRFLARIVCKRDIITHSATMYRKALKKHDELHGDDGTEGRELSKFKTNVIKSPLNNLKKMVNKFHFNNVIQERKLLQADTPRSSPEVNSSGGKKDPCSALQLNEIVIILRKMCKEQIQNEREDDRKQEWVLISVIIDRLFLYIHFCIIIGLGIFVLCFTEGVIPGHQ